jgi:hypothetical protein
MTRPKGPLVTRDTLGTVFAGTLAVCAVAITFLWVRREMVGPPEDIRVRKVANWQDFATGGHQFGSDGAPVEVVVFSDFQCSFCSLLAARLDSLAARMRGDVSIRFRHFPMTNLHRQSGGAAMAAECAARQGRFKQYHDALFAKQDSIGLLPWTSFVGSSDIPDLEQFKACVADSATVARVNEDVEAGLELRVRGTPSILVNEVFHHGLPSLPTMESMVRKALRAKGQSPRPYPSSANSPETSMSAALCATVARSIQGIENVVALKQRYGNTVGSRLSRREVCVGMSPDMIRVAWGNPQSILKQSREGIELAEWRYSSKSVVLANDTVAAFK